MTWSCFTGSQVKINKNKNEDGADTWNGFAIHYKLFSLNRFNDSGIVKVSVC